MPDGVSHCPRCGAVSENFDDVLGRMKKEVAQCLSEYREEPIVLGAKERTKAERQAEKKDRFELLAEVAQIKGEVQALRGEVERLQAAQYAMAIQAAQAQPVVYAQAYSQENPSAGYLPYSGRMHRKRARSRNRIILSALALVLLLLSVAMFFLPWVRGEGAFSGYEALRYLFAGSRKNDAGAAFSVYLNTVIAEHPFSVNEIVSDVCRAFCTYLLKFGIPLYAFLLVFGIPILLSLFGRIRLAGWHRCFAWTSFFAALAIFGGLCWVSGFSAVSVPFLVGGGANLARGILLIFYRGKWDLWCGLEN